MHMHINRYPHRSRTLHPLQSPKMMDAIPLKPIHNLQLLKWTETVESDFNTMIGPFGVPTAATETPTFQLMIVKPVALLGIVLNNSGTPFVGEAWLDGVGGQSLGRFLFPTGTSMVPIAFPIITMRVAVSVVSKEGEVCVASLQAAMPTAS